MWYSEEHAFAGHLLATWSYRLENITSISSSIALGLWDSLEGQMEGVA